MRGLATLVAALTFVGKAMRVRKFNVADANLVRSPGQDGDIFVGNLVDEKAGGPVTVGYGRYGTGPSLTETIAVHDRPGR